MIRMSGNNCCICVVLSKVSVTNGVHIFRMKFRKGESSDFFETVCTYVFGELITNIIVKIAD